MKMADVMQGIRILEVAEHTFVPAAAAVGAPASLAVDLAKTHDMTLIGFLKSDSFNIYHGNWRIS